MTKKYQFLPSLAPEQAAEKAAGRQGEEAGDDASQYIDALHGDLMAANIALCQISNAAPQAYQCQRDQQVNGRKAPNAHRVRASDKGR